MTKDEVYHQDERLSGLESRVSVLESKIDDGLKSLEKVIDTRIGNIEKDINDLIFSMNQLKLTVQDLSKNIIASRVKYNGYEEKFATKVELKDLQVQVDNIKARQEGINGYISRWGMIVAMISSFLAILLALKSLGF